MYATPLRFTTRNGPIYFGASLRVPSADTAYVGRFCVDSNTESPNSKESVFVLPFASACAFCRSLAAAIASCTKRTTASRTCVKSRAVPAKRLATGCFFFVASPCDAAILASGGAGGSSRTVSLSGFESALTADSLRFTWDLVITAARSISLV